MQRENSDLPVVLVDDEEDILFGASYLLNSHGIQTVTTLCDAREIMPFFCSRKRQASSYWISSCLTFPVQSYRRRSYKTIRMCQ